MEGEYVSWLCLFVLIYWCIYSWFKMFCLISAVQQSDSVIRMLICFSYSFPLSFITGYCIEFHVLNRTLLFIHPICKSLYLLVPNFQSFPLPSHLPLGNHKSNLYIYKSVLFHRYVHWCHILDSTYKWYHMAFILLIFFS